MAIRMRFIGTTVLVLVLVVSGSWWVLAQSAPGQPVPPAKPTPPQAKPLQPAPSKDPSQDPPKSPLLKALYDAIDGIDGIEDSTNKELGGRDDIRNQLRDADGTLDRIRRENMRALSNASRQTPLPTQPNIVLIVLDNLPWEHLGCYGQQVIQTPVIDRLAARGTKFTHFRLGAGNPSPRWLLLTDRSIKVGDPIALRPGEKTVAQALWRAAYTTAWIGDYYLSAGNAAINPAELGFDYWYGSPDPTSPYYPERLIHRGQEVDVPENIEGKHHLYINDAYSQHASAWIHQHRLGQAHRPFFLMVSYRVPAKDWQAPENDAYDQENWSPTTKAWASMVTGVDRGIGNLVTALAEARQLRNTVIVVTAVQRRATVDGDQVFTNEQSSTEDADEAQQGIRLPLVVFGYGRVAAGLVADEPVTMVDLPPTLAELAKFSKGSTGFPGKSLGDTLRSMPAATVVTPKATETPPEPAAPAAPVKPARKLPQIIRGRP